MRFWRKVPGVLKDRKSILIANLAKRTTLRNPDIETAVIRATSHDPSFFDHKNARRIYGWICVSPACLRPFVWSLCVRLEKTRSWVVVLKGLIVMHGLFNCRVPTVQKVGRLPFDLAAFKEGHMGPINAFIRDFFTFLDQKSAFMSMDYHEQQSNENSENEEQEDEEGKVSIKEEILNLQKLQILLDMLLRIKPHEDTIFKAIIREAMDCVLIEIFGIYSTICRGIANLVVKIYFVDKAEATMALKVLKKANAQGEELSKYFGFCTRLGILKTSDCPKLELVPEEDLHEMEQMVHIVAGEYKYFLYEDEDTTTVGTDSDKADEHKHLDKGLRTIITSKWELFDEDMVRLSSGRKTGKMAMKEESQVAPVNHQQFPDLIKF